MAWVTLRTVVDGVDTILASDHNGVKGNIEHIGDGVSLRLTQTGSTPSAPGAGLTVVYAKTDGAVYVRSGTGAESPIGGGGYSRAFMLMGG